LKKVRIICRSSRLSVLQAEMVKQRILSVLPGTEVQIIARSSRGDRELDVNLSVLDGTDFFTEDIFSALQKKEADIAVHSLKDMSAMHFFSHAAFAVVDRDDVRDVAIFNPGIEEKIRAGKTIIIGTCSPRREEMAITFLKKALPQLHNDIKIEIRPIRGNVERRLQQLDAGKYDATILATAGLNRLLKNEDESAIIHRLLKNKHLMLLPLIECVPAPCQGAIVAEADPGNEAAVTLLKKINDAALFQEAYAEKKKAMEYGIGCLQKFGVTTIRTAHTATVYSAGEDNEGRRFTDWSTLPAAELAGINLFSSTDYMKHFFRYEWSNEKLIIAQPVVFVANYKAAQHSSVCGALTGKIIYASGTKTWVELAKQGYWVQGCADALGVEWFLPALQMPLLSTQKKDVCILTHEAAAERWKQKGLKAVSNYRLINERNETVLDRIASANWYFWSSFSQYNYYGKYCSADAVHACAGGETAALLKQEGIEPLIFPTIKSFEQWRQSNARPLSVA
jgi:hydroxymethylbilane synthase